MKIVQLNKIAGLASLALGLMVIGQSANATLYNFAGLANTIGEGGYDSLVVDDTNTIGGASGITVTATATWLDTSGDEDVTVAAFAYLDANCCSGDAGLGVAKVLTGNGNPLDHPTDPGPAQVTPSDDDNVSEFETLSLLFSESVRLTEIIFRNDSHGTSFTGHFLLSVNSGTFVQYALTNLFQGTAAFFGTSFDFKYDDEQFYIASINVPEPGTLIMMAMGLGLLGFSRRKSVQ